VQADICQLGMDQRKVNMLAREYCDDCKPKRLKPVILSHPMMPGLLEVGAAAGTADRAAGRAALGGGRQGADGRSESSTRGRLGRLVESQARGGKGGLLIRNRITLWYTRRRLPTCLRAGPGEDEQERPQQRHLHGGQRGGGEDQDQEGLLPPQAGAPHSRQRAPRRRPNCRCLQPRQGARALASVPFQHFPPTQVEGNPCLAYVKDIVLPWFEKFEVERAEQNGGNK
jgi:hypothetical protein